jgi:hypothetical protein
MVAPAGQQTAVPALFIDKRVGRAAGRPFCYYHDVIDPIRSAATSYILRSNVSISVGE